MADDWNEEAVTNHLNALWKSGRDKLRSFYEVLNTVVRPQIGDAAFASWVFDHIRDENGRILGLTAIQEVKDIFDKADAKRIAADLAPAARAANRAAAKEARADAKANAAAEIAAAKAAAEIAKANAETAAAKIAENKVQRRETRRRIDASNPHRLPPSRTPIDHRNRLLKNNDACEMEDLAARLRAALEMTQRGESLWIEGSVALAIGLATARTRFGKDDSAFGEWLEANSISLQKDTRSALINLGSFAVARLQKIFETRDSNSYRTIWAQHSRPDLRLVE